MNSEWVEYHSFFYKNASVNFKHFFFKEKIEQRIEFFFTSPLSTIRQVCIYFTRELSLSKQASAEC